MCDWCEGTTNTPAVRQKPSTDQPEIIATATFSEFPFHLITRYAKAKIRFTLHYFDNTARPWMLTVLT